MKIKVKQNFYDRENDLALREKGAETVCPFCGYDPTGSAKKHPMALRPESILNGRYILGRVLGQGGFGITYIAQDYQTKETFGYLVFISESGLQYDDLWVNVSGLDKTFLASTAQIVDGEVKGMRYGAQQGKRRVMIREKNDRLLYQDIVEIRAGEDTIIKFKD